MRKKKKALDPMVLVLILTIVFLPPLAPLAVVLFLVYKRIRNQAEPAEQDDKDNFGEKLIRHMKAEEAKERPFVSKGGQTHSHTPVAYSYDACAKEKRLEQLKVLKGAGLLDESEYQQRRQAILAQR